MDGKKNSIMTDKSGKIGKKNCKLKPKILRFIQPCLILLRQLVRYIFEIYVYSNSNKYRYRYSIANYFQNHHRTTNLRDSIGRTRPEPDHFPPI